MFSVVCISHTDGSGGEKAGRIVAAQLGYRYVDDEIIVDAAKIGGVDPSLVAASEKQRRRTLAERLWKTIGTGTIAIRRVDGGATGPSDDELRGAIRAAIDAIAKDGRAVIVAHAASMALGGRADVLRVLVTAPDRVRARRLAETRGLAVAAAEGAIGSGDQARREYLRAFYEVEAELPTHYDVVITTETLSQLQVAALIVFAARGAIVKAPRWTSLSRWFGR